MLSDDFTAALQTHTDTHTLSLPFSLCICVCEGVRDESSTGDPIHYWVIKKGIRLGKCPKWHPIPYIVLYLLPQPYGEK